MNKIKCPVGYEATADIDGVHQFGVYLIYSRKRKEFCFLNNKYELVNKKSSEIYNIKIDRRTRELE